MFGFNNQILESTNKFTYDDLFEKAMGLVERYETVIFVSGSYTTKMRQQIVESTDTKLEFIPAPGIPIKIDFSTREKPTEQWIEEVRIMTESLCNELGVEIPEFSEPTYGELDEND